MFSWEYEQKNSLGDMLVESGKITAAQLKEVLNFQVNQDKKLEEILIDLSFLSEDDLVNFLSEKFYINKIELTDDVIDSNIVKLLSKDAAIKYNAIAFNEEDGMILIAMSDPNDLAAIDDLRFICKKPVKTYIAKRSTIKNIIDKYYKQETTDKVIEQLEEEFKLDVDNEVDTKSMLEVENAPAVKLANSLLTDAIDTKVSDIHIEPYEKEVIVRYRIDGVLKDHMIIPINLYSSVSTRLKIVAGMDIAEKRLPQDGRIELKYKEKPYDFRVSSLPTVFGEKIVMRILDRTGSILERSKLAFTDHENKLIDKILGMPNGILLVTGPTGSGKTTTLYSFLDELNTPEKNITTIEDPVEYMLPRINQVHVNNKAGMNFAAGLRSMLRQDPDIIMIGEVRDEETAQIAVRASITGHFVLSTLHTNDAPSTISRLMDMGIESYLVADAVKGIIAQRLIRRLCPKCKELSLTDKGENEVLGIETSQTIYKAKGCSFCNNTGYKGRIALHEVLLMNASVKKAIEDEESIEKIREIAIKTGLVTLYENCKEIVMKGETTVGEMVKIVHGGE